MNETWVGREANGGVEVRRDSDPVVSEEEGPWLPVVEVRAPLDDGETYGDPRYRLSDDGSRVEVVYDAIPDVTPTPVPVVPVVDPDDVHAARAQIAGATTIAALRVAMLRFLDVIDPAVPAGAVTAVGDSTGNPSGGTHDGTAR